jgi:hypothetical protein
MTVRPRAIRQTWTIIAAMAAALLAVVFCTRKEEPPAAPPPAATAPAPSAAAPAAAALGTNVIKGTVKLTGTPPEMKPLHREADPFCARSPMKEEDVMVGPGGGLKNVLVRVIKGAAGSFPPPAQPAIVDQTECMYRPRVQGIVAGQPIQIRNSDQTLHNVHSYKGPSTLFNQAEIPGMPPMTKRVGEAGDVIKFKCDVHPWMTGYVGISSNPFFAVTGDDGSFTIDKLPPGAYTLEAWHERFGAKTADVTVAAGQPATVTLSFAAP